MLHSVPISKEGIGVLLKNMEAVIMRNLQFAKLNRDDDRQRL